MKTKAFFFIFFALSVILTSIPARSHPRESFFGEQKLGDWKNGILSAGAEAPGPASNGHVTKLVLADNRTIRPDILRHFQRYHGGWDISNKHYWASVGSTGAPGFIVAVLWLVSFGLALVIHYCCGCRIMNGQGSDFSQRICLIMLIVFTCAAAIGCILLSVGQDKFYDEALHTLNFVVNQSDYTVRTLRNVTQYLSLAKTVSVAKVFLPSDVLRDIDKLNIDLNAAADALKQKTNENSGKIRRVFDAVRSALITVAAVMLLISVLGLVLSVLGHQHVIHIFVISGWLLVAMTFVLCGVFVILNNAISDTCMAMEEWVENPQAETALSNILPCVDETTTNQTLFKSKQVINDIATIVNSFIDSFANSNPPPQANPNYYNQSGPLLPHLCYPYDSLLQDRVCSSQEVSMANASLVWKNYTCTVLTIGICSSAGRLTPDMFDQLVTAVNISYALKHYTPPLLNLQNCNFVRQTFLNITSNYCHPLEHNLKMIDAGFGLISAAVMLSLALWMFYANHPRRKEVFANLSLRIKGKGRRKDNNVGNDGGDHSDKVDVLPNRPTPDSGV